MLSFQTVIYISFYIEIELTYLKACFILPYTNVTVAAIY